MWKNYDVNGVQMWTYMDGPISIQLSRSKGTYEFSCPLLGIISNTFGVTNTKTVEAADTEAQTIVCDLCIAKAAELIDILRLAKLRIVAHP